MSDRRQLKISDRHIRQIFGGLAITSFVAVVYASAIPLRYQPASIAEVWSEFLHTRWLTLGLNKRADWVANGLVMIPFGFFFAGSFDWPKSSFAKRQAAFILFLLLHGLVVCGIEAMQVWFPPRVRSLNDMLAGYLGGLAGVLIWHLIGRRLTQAILRFAETPKGLPRIHLLAIASASALVVFGAMPMDVMLSPSEWMQKVELGGFVWLPVSDWNRLKDPMISIVMSSWAFPFGVILGLHYADSKQAIGTLVKWCIAIELASLPIFSATTSITDVLLRSLIGVFGVLSCYTVHRWLNRFNRPNVWLLAAFAMTLLIFVAFLGRYQEVITDPKEWSRRLVGIITTPFASAQKSSELVAAQNILGKIFIFSILGFLITGWSQASRQSAKKVRLFGLTLIWCMLVGTGIEVAQAFLLPFKADVTDILLSGIGASIGALSYWTLIPIPGSRTRAHESNDAGER